MTKRPVPEDSLEESTEKSASGSDPGLSDTFMKDTEGNLTGEHFPPVPEGRYRVDERAGDALLGRGAQGTVWRAYDKVLRREIAVKKLHSKALGDPAVVAAFLREARLTALLEHPGIVPLHDLGRGPDGALYFSLRRIEGKSLFDTLTAADGLDGRLALVPALVRACQAVAFAHEHGVVHRDLKPQNIMLGRFGETYVLDWGLALVEDRTGRPDVTAPFQTTGIVGTPAYMSPEQALGLAADARSDVWGLGGCLYHLLAGQPPIGGRSLQSAVGHASHGEVSPVLAVEPLAPPDLAAICEKALSPERSLRYPNATALAADLEAWLAGRTVSARAYTRGQLLGRALKANRRAVSVVTLGLLVLGAVIGFDEWRVRKERNEARTFVRELIRELPQQVDASRANVEMINALTSRTERWLARTDLSMEELVEACDVLTRLAAINSDINDVPAARELYNRTLELSVRGLALEPEHPLFVSCEVEAKSGLAYLETEAGDPARGLRLYEEAWARLEAWPGELPPELRIVRADLAYRWGNWLWAKEPAKGAALFIEAAQTVLPLLDSPVRSVRRNALERGINAVPAIWMQGRIDDAAALARRFYEAAEADCADPSMDAQRTCLLPVSSYASMVAWVDAPETKQVQRQAIEVEALVHAHDVDSAAALYDAVLMFLELGLYPEATARSQALRLSKSASWGKELGPLAAVLAGDLAEVDAWAPFREESETGGRLAWGLREAARGQYIEAAKHLRAVKHARIWFDISWTPHPAPKLELPPAARPAFEHFLAEFTAAYRAADMKRIETSLEELALAFEALE